MKIGILTCHRVHNYGAVLQGYALLQFLKKEGHDAKIIDYWPSYRKGMYSLIGHSFKKKSNLQTIYHILARFLKLPFSIVRSLEKLIRYKRFEIFIQNFLGVSRIPEFSNGEEITDDCDIYIVGSDQIWKYYEFPKEVGFDGVYWGSFLKNSGSKKISYAASMGSIVTEKNKIDYIRKNIQNIHAISVRESQLKNFLYSHTGIEAEHVLDPAFLLDKSEWGKMINFKLEKKLQKKKYVLHYNLTPNIYSKKTADIVAQKFNLEIVEIQGSFNPLSFAKKHYQTTGPIEFITLIKNADFIIASSFHGIVFSLIFEKSFYAVGMENSTDRVESLLSLLDINDRFLKNHYCFHPNHINEYASIKMKINFGLQKSKDFLKRQIC